MSTSIHDFVERDKLSNCCGSSMHDLGGFYICGECKEHCEAVSDDDCFMIDHAQKCAGCSHYDHPIKNDDAFENTQTLRDLGN